MSAPAWLPDLLAEHHIAQLVTAQGCFTCTCQHESTKVPAGEIWGVGDRDGHDAHVAEVVWSMLTQRVGLEIKEGQMRSIQNAANNSIGYQIDTEYRLTSRLEADA